MYEQWNQLGSGFWGKRCIRGFVKEEAESELQSRSESRGPQPLPATPDCVVTGHTARPELSHSLEGTVRPSPSPRPLLALF